MLSRLKNVKVRGIYTTALTKLFLDLGFEMVQPSLTIKNRFKISDNPAPPDLQIKDRYDLQGVEALGTTDAIDTFQSILHSTLEDVLTRRWQVSVDGIYKGRITESNENIFYVDMGDNIQGRLPKAEISETNNKQQMVQVERKRIGTRQPLLTTYLKIIGNYALLAKNSGIGVSLKIHDPNKRAELYAFGKTLAPQGWGIIWRETSANQSSGILEAEIAMLIEKARLLEEKALDPEGPTLLVEGSYYIDVEFPSSSKKNLDKLRAIVAPTLDRHHFYKSCEGKIAVSLEAAEKLLEREQNAEVEKTFKEQILGEFPEHDSQVNVEHVKLSGLVFDLGVATIESSDEEQFRYSRIMRSDGFYDGLDVKKEAGDKAISETKTSEWFITTNYFSNNEEWKGTYINLNTPIEVYPNTIRYVDLEVDACIRPDGMIEVVDLEKLEEALEKRIISQRLLTKVKDTLKIVVKS